MIGTLAGMISMPKEARKTAKPGEGGTGRGAGAGQGCPRPLGGHDGSGRGAQALACGVRGPFLAYDQTWLGTRRDRSLVRLVKPPRSAHVSGDCIRVAGRGPVASGILGLDGDRVLSRRQHVLQPDPHPGLVVRVVRG